ncbi:CHK domain-containing protein [Aphelenchoides fujianensis]|nr:CHK domain-containing protein [Aphelenchoides fujianensis]
MSSPDCTSQSSADSDDQRAELDGVLKKSGYSLEWLLAAMRSGDSEFRRLEAESDIRRITFKNIGESKGFCSFCFRVVYEFANSAVRSFVAKIPMDSNVLGHFRPMGLTEEQMGDLSATVFRLHDVECEAYGMLGDLAATGFPIPRVFGAAKHEEGRARCILLEDLSGAGEGVELFDSLTAAQCLEFADHIADFQAFAHSLPSSVWRGGRYRRELWLHGDAREDEATKANFHAQPMHECSDQFDVVRTFLQLDFPRFVDYALHGCAEEAAALALCHGDTRGNNVLISRDSGKIVAILDWALLAEGNPLFDLCRFIVTGADGDVRRAVETEALDRFHSRLAEKLAPEQPPFTREQATVFFELALLHQTAELIGFFTMCALPLLQSGVAGESEKVEKFWERLRFAFEDAAPLLRKHRIVERFGLEKRTDE